MQYRTLGSTGLRISEIGFGCGNTGGLLTGANAEEQQRAAQRALELGITYFDTAPNYGERFYGVGTSETHLGQVLKSLGARPPSSGRLAAGAPPPEPAVSLPKGGEGWAGGYPLIGTKVEFRPDDLDHIPETVAHSVDASLERLGVEAVDVLYLHNRVGAERVLSPSAMGSRLSVRDVLGSKGVLECFEGVRREGKARYLGFCSSGGDPAANRQIVDSGGFHCVQLTYNLLNPTEGRLPPPGFRDSDHGQVMEYAAARGLGVVVIRVLGGGVLSGVAQPHPLNTGSRVETEYREGATRAQALRFLERPGEQTMAQTALRFALGHPGVSTVLVGFSEVAQIEEAVQASGKGGLPAEDLARIEGLYATDFGVSPGSPR